MTFNWKWLLALAVLAAFLFSNQGIRSYWSKRRTAKELEKKLEDLKRSNQEMVFEVHRLKNDPRALEQVARRELGLLQPGEMEYRFIVKRSSRPEK